MMPMTTNSSTSVKPDEPRTIRCDLDMLISSRVNKPPQVADASLGHAGGNIMRSRVPLATANQQAHRRHHHTRRTQRFHDLSHLRPPSVEVLLLKDDVTDHPVRSRWLQTGTWFCCLSFNPDRPIHPRCADVIRPGYSLNHHPRRPPPHLKAVVYGPA